MLFLLKLRASLAMSVIFLALTRCLRRRTLGVCFVSVSVSLVISTSSRSAESTLWPTQQRASAVPLCSGRIFSVANPWPCCLTARPPGRAGNHPPAPAAQCRPGLLSGYLTGRKCPLIEPPPTVPPLLVGGLMNMPCAGG